MKAIILKGHGDYDQLALKLDQPTPVPKENEVLIQVKAAGVNNTDINTRIGWYAKSHDLSKNSSWSRNTFTFPRIQGADVCGYIVKVGANIDPNRIGERVLIEPSLQEINGTPLQSSWYFGSECDGGFAQYTIVSSRHAHRIESKYSNIELASFPCSYSTAENLLSRSDVGASDTVLVTGASGGVGSATIQLALARGAKVIAITSAKKFEAIKSLGVSQVISRDDDVIQVLGENSVDVIIDLVGGAAWPKLLEVLKPKGRYAISGAIGGAEVTLDLRTLYLKDLNFLGCTELNPGVFSNLIKRIEKEEIRPLIAKVYPLFDIIQAQKEFLEKKHIGKIVLEVS